ncbi:carbohydrate-binding module family 13 protein [Rhizophagus clarus]|uniref:Carbohydrate-binding module family 13 protein n=1 Tax=Rhizophagus clarus TaxID=94130 RepID=A0A8H3KYV9_9GLOM|nr:carbohydrate-binding module family 13 protein [Rhizophagus clarus]
MADNKLLPKLSQNLLEILNDEEYYDIIIEVVLRYIYGGKISLEEYDMLDIVKVLVAANELSLQELIPYLESFLIEEKENWVEQNFDLIYQISLENDSFSELQKYCNNLIAKESNKIFNSPNFSSISEKLLITLIQNVSLQTDEIQIWEYVIRWGLAQNPELPSDPTSFSNDDFNILKNTLQQCIPFIRFHNLSSKEFLKRVEPYKKILPKELYNDLLDLDNDNEKSIPHIIKEDKKNIDSKIITLQHTELISKWIDRLETTDKLTTSYEFKLLYQESRDGDDNFYNFREICKDQLRTVIVIKTKGGNEILGGYNPIEWKFDSKFGVTGDSFIFSFINNSIENYILSRVKYEKNAIYTGKHHLAPSFNDDLYLYRDYSGELRISCEIFSYEKLIKEFDINSCIVEEFEVFQIV